MSCETKPVLRLVPKEDAPADISRDPRFTTHEEVVPCHRLMTVTVEFSPPRPDGMIEIKGTATWNGKVYILGYRSLPREGNPAEFDANYVGMLNNYARLFAMTDAEREATCGLDRL